MGCLITLIRFPIGLLGTIIVWTLGFIFLPLEFCLWIIFLPLGAIFMSRAEFRNSWINTFPNSFTFISETTSQIWEWVEND